MNAANHRLLRMIAEFDRCGGWRLDGSMRSCAHWLVTHCGITLGAAREKVRVARQLEVLPEVNGVFSEGGLSYSKVRAITRVATPENEGFMVHLAQQNSAGHLERLVSRYEPVPEPGLEGLLEWGPEEVAAASHEAAEAAAAGIADDAAEARATPPLDAEAMRELARELFVLHVDVNTLREQRSGVCCTHGRAHFEDKPWLAPATARRLSCDASLVTVLEDDAGTVLNVGRKSRIVPEPIRRALRERDGVCQYPGCQESEYVDAHHIQHWADGGETRLDNLVSLCRFHHRQLHRGCFDIRLNGTSAEILAAEELEIVDYH